MAFDCRVYRILIASPSDVQAEREAAVRVMLTGITLIHTPTASSFFLSDGKLTLLLNTIFGHKNQSTVE